MTATTDATNPPQAANAVSVGSTDLIACAKWHEDAADSYCFAMMDADESQRAAYREEADQHYAWANLIRKQAIDRSQRRSEPSLTPKQTPDATGSLRSLD
jgi:hypothetical protein